MNLTGNLREKLGLIALSSYEDADWRRDRLILVLGYVCALAGKETLDKVVGLHDDQGTLVVTWKTEPTGRDKLLFALAWSSDIGDECGDVMHVGV